MNYFSQHRSDAMTTSEDKTNDRLPRRFVGWILSICVVTTSLLAGCAAGPLVDDPFQFDREQGASDEFSQWLDGGDVDVDDGLTAEHLFLAGESSYWEGDFDGAYDYYVAMLRDHPGHALNRYAANRLYRLRHDVIDFAQRLYGDWETVRYDEEGALTRLELTRLAQVVSYERWRQSEVDEPYEFEHGAKISTWRATPALSPWRLLDFDEPMSPEDAETLSPQYRSPEIAGADPANWDRTRTVSTEGLRQYPRLGGSGIYYLEGRLSVESNPDTEADAAREVTLSGRFPGAARVWIGDTEVLEWREDSYESGRLLRQVELEPGDHRVLVKLAYDPGGKDWFELLGVPTGGAVFGDAGFHSGHDVGEAGAGVETAGETRRAAEIEPVRLPVDELSGVDGPLLYTAALSAHASGDFQMFPEVWEELMERYPEFAPGYLLGSQQVRTRSDLTADLRQSRSISMLRRAQELEPDNLYMLVQLEDRLQQHGSDEEYRRVLERARQLARGADPGQIEVASAESADVEFNVGEVRNLRPLVAWARYLERQGWYREAEEAWEEVLAADPANCRAMRRLQSLYGTRNVVPDPAELSERASSCPDVIDRWLDEDPGKIDQQVELARRQADRHPYGWRNRLELADVLRAADRRQEAVEVLDQLIDDKPWVQNIWQRRIEWALADGDEETARRLVDEAILEVGRNSYLENLGARIDGQIPLEELLRDGRQAALDEVRRTGEQAGVDEGDQSERAMVMDDAYYVVDFAADRYFDDGSAWTLTHQVVRVMTRGAIDNYAQMSVPGGADLLLARTIKEDGEVRVPDGMSGGSTLSMPGLSPGDMVEIAYLEFKPASRLATRIDGTRFYFQMPSVSSRHSEYVVVNTRHLDFETANGAPDGQEFEFDGLQSVRFVAEDTRRPRNESRRVSAQEYLPWVREVRRGVDIHMLDVERRYMQNAVVESARMAPEVEEKFEEWLGTPIDDLDADDELVHQLFYAVAEWFRSSSPGAFSTDAVHAIQQRRGSPLVVMHLALSQLGVEHDIYAVRTDEEPPFEQSVGEMDRYKRAMLRVEMPDSGQVQWIKPDRRDAMFGAFEPELDGQNAVCITCDNFHEETVRLAADRRPARHLQLDADLDSSGTLRGTLRFEFDGVRAARVRAALRGRTDDTDRRDYFERVLTGQISGADLVDYQVIDEEQPDRQLAFEIGFERPGFARLGDGRLVIDRPVFREAMQRIYARQATRRTPMFVGYEREQSYSVTIGLPDAVDVQLRSDEIDDLSSAFGAFQRQSWLEDGAFRLESSIDLSRQRISAEDYGQFRDWARTVEESGAVWLAVELGE